MKIGQLHYPDNWPEITAELKNKAHWRCQICGVQCEPKPKDKRHMLTVAHIDHDTENKEARLVALCTQCHLYWDHDLHKISSRHTQSRRKRLDLGNKKRNTKR